MFEVKLYGEVVPFQDAWLIECGGYINLTTVQNQLKEAKGGDVLVRINSFGGDVDEGFAIYSELRRYVKDNGAKVRTLAEGRCASIATVIFLAGDERVVTEHTSPFVHNAWTYTWDGTSKSLKRIAADLEKVDNQIAQHYSTHTNLTVDEALELMNNDTSISPEECIEMRFATEIEEVLRPVALQQILKRNSNKQMSDTKKNKSVSVLTKIRGLLGVHNKIVKTADQRELDFYELADDDTPKVGDRAKYEGQDANGEFVMADGKTFMFTDGELIEIRDPETETTEEVEAEVKDLKEQVSALETALNLTVEKLVPEIEKLRSDNKKLNSTFEKLKGTSSVAPQGGHERAANSNSKDTEVSKAVSEFRINKAKNRK